MVYYSKCYIGACCVVIFAYKQCLLVYGYHPDMWYDAVSYLENASKSASDRGVGNKQSWGQVPWYLNNRCLSSGTTNT